MKKPSTDMNDIVAELMQGKALAKFACEHPEGYVRIIMNDGRSLEVLVKFTKEDLEISAYELVMTPTMGLIGKKSYTTYESATAYLEELIIKENA